MSMLAAPDAITGPLTAADLDRDTNQGRIYSLHLVTVCPPCDGLCNQGRDCNAESCATEGGMHADPVSTQRYRPGVGVVLVLLGWPIVAVAVAAVAFIAQHVG